MLKQSILLLWLIYAVAALEIDTSSNVENVEPIVMCKRIVCEDCPETYDENGCIVCDCDHPCKKANCASTEFCITEHNEDGTGKAVCKEKEPCPVYKCMRNCKFGYKKDQKGCPGCECKSHTCEDHECEEGKVCQPKTVQCFDLPCPKLPACVWKPMCMRKKEAWLANHAGTDLLSPFLQGHIFADKGRSMVEHDTHLLGEDDESRGPNASSSKKHLFGEDEESRGPSNEESKAHLFGEDEESRGPRIDGSKKHLFGEDEESRGPSSDGSKKYLFGEDEESRGPSSDDTKKHLFGEDEESRGPKSLFGTDEASKGLDFSSVFPQCNEHGDFLPLQCDVDSGICWCVDDRGIIMDNTVTDMNKAEKKPLCSYNRTTAIHGHMKIEHDIEDIEPHLPVIKKVAHAQLSEWLVIGKEFISITEMRSCPSEIHAFTLSFSVFADDKGQNDLAAASFNLEKAAHHNDLAIPYHGHTLKPKAESFHVHHQFEPLLPERAIRTHSSEFNFNQRWMVILAGLLGITFFLLVLLVLLKMMLTKRSRMRSYTVKEPMHTYKENLKFAQKFFNKSDDKEDKLGPLTELEAGNDSVA